MSEAAQNDAVLSASSLSIAFGSRPLLDGGTIAILEGERVGVVGRNGCGKSTFLKIAAAAQAPDSGQVTLRRGLLIGYLPQDFELEDQLSVHEAVMKGAAAVQSLLAEYDLAPADSSRAADLLQRIEQLDGWELESRAKAILSHLNAPEPSRIVGTLSGGEKRRVALCRALIARPDLLVLDEPTNHLDTESIQWLEDFLAKYRGTCLFVTHDRYFLDRVSTRIVEITQGKFISFQGNYTDFLIAQMHRESVAEHAEHRREKFLRRELEWVRRAPSARRTKSIDRVERYFEMASAGPPEKLGDVDIILPPPKELGNRVISIRNVSYSIEQRVLISKLTLEIPPNARIGVVGRNGVGKTTLLRLLTGELQPTSGTIELGARTELNVVDQHRLQIDPSRTVWDEVGEGKETLKLGEETLSLRAYLRRFLFTEDRIGQAISQLSGGERSRVLLAKILKRGGNVLLLDEPTNDLDLSTLRLLEEALIQFKGTIVLVSHDRYFMNRVCTHTLALNGDGSIQFDVGNYEEFILRRAKMESSAKMQGKPPTQELPAMQIRSARAAKLTWKEERELEGIDQTILQAESKLAELEAILSDPVFYKERASEAQSVQIECENQREKIASLYERWEALEQKRIAALQPSTS
jgi:ATP-binding cassette subfamily F protein uup